MLCWGTIYKCEKTAAKPSHFLLLFLVKIDHFKSVETIFSFLVSSANLREIFLGKYISSSPMILKCIVWREKSKKIFGGFQLLKFFLLLCLLLKKSTNACDNVWNWMNTNRSVNLQNNLPMHSIDLEINYLHTNLL